MICVTLVSSGSADRTFLLKTKDENELEQRDIATEGVTHLYASLKVKPGNMRKYGSGSVDTRQADSMLGVPVQPGI